MITPLPCFHRRDKKDVFDGDAYSREIGFFQAAFELCLASPVWLTQPRTTNAGPEFMTDILIELRADDPARNRRRAWRVVAGADLFGLWVAYVSFGRIGAAGRTMRHEFASEAAAIRFVRRGLHRRATAVQRLGVPYRPVEASPVADRLLLMSGLR